MMSSVTIRLSRFLGSMNLAISLLVIIAIASVVGTILKQNEPYQNYIVKFGPYWHQVFRSLGLYDIYSTPWFVIIMAFLVISTSICLYRNAPKVLASLKQFQLQQQADSIRSLPAHGELLTSLSATETQTTLERWLQQQGYKVRSNTTDTYSLIAAMKGQFNRYGYVFTHLAIIIICIGGLLDSNFPLKVQRWLGQVKIETRTLPLSELDPASILAEDNRSFRASVSIPEGSTINAAFINMEAGYLVQPLPFAVHVKDFRIEHYDNGQPKSFQSDLVLMDEETNETIEQMIEVNHPLTYKGYTIYQASFGDGGSILELGLHDLANGNMKETVSMEVGETAEITFNNRVFQFETKEFRKFNIFANDNPAIDKKFRDYGPSVTFTLRQTDGTAREYLNYMYPVQREGKEFILSGMRESLQDEYRYLYIPADDDGSPALFMSYLSLLRDETRLQELFSKNQEQLFQSSELTEQISSEEITTVLLQLVRFFLIGGFEQIQKHFQNAPEIESLETASIKMLQYALQLVWIETLQQTGEDINNINERHITFLQDSILALSALHKYGSPFYVQLQDFQHIEATGLQITRSPGTFWVYLGFLLLICGVFFLFYVPHQRLWFHVQQQGTKTSLIYGGTRTRHQADFQRQFNNISNTIRQAFPP